MPPAYWWVRERTKRSARSHDGGILRAWDHLARVVNAPAESEALQIAGMTVDVLSGSGVLSLAALITARASVSTIRPLDARLTIRLVAIAP